MEEYPTPHPQPPIPQRLQSSLPKPATIPHGTYDHLLNTILSLKWTPKQIWQCKGMRTLHLNQSFTRVLWGKFCFSALTNSEQHTNPQGDLITLQWHVFLMYFQYLLFSVPLHFQPTVLDLDTKSHMRIYCSVYVREMKEWKRKFREVGTIKDMPWAKLVRVYYRSQQEQKVLLITKPFLQSPNWSI